MVEDYSDGKLKTMANNHNRIRLWEIDRTGMKTFVDTFNLGVFVKKYVFSLKYFSMLLLLISFTSLLEV